MEIKRTTWADHHRDLAERAFGEEVDRVYQDREFAFKSLQAESWKRRYVSLSLLHFHWQIGDDILVPICKLAFENDDHIQVRQKALSVLGSLFEHSFDPAASSYLAKIVLDETCSNRVRRSAFEAIEKVRTEQPIASQFQNVELSDLSKVVEQAKIRVEELTRYADESPDFDRKLMERLAWGD